MAMRVHANRNSNERDEESQEPLEVESLIPRTSRPVTTLFGNTSSTKMVEFLISFGGLIVSYCTWGVMQELIMNTKFSPSPLVPSGMFPSSTFCVFSNRAFAIVVALIACYWRHGSVTSAASWISFTPAALSNTISSWAQYESLAYVSFPLQNLFKSTKLIPVMIMGNLLNNTQYSMTEILEAISISIGVLVFSMTKSSQKANVSGGVSVYDSSAIGIVLLGVYIISDSFTSQYQTAIYKQYGKIDQFHMMFGVNLSAICITAVALIVSGEIPIVIDFLYYNPVALIYNIITAITSATGQLFIYYTIRKFGPVVFTIIMTTRQILSMVISTIYFRHPMLLSSAVGAMIVFLTVFHSIYRQMNSKTGGGAAV